ncbi:MAG: glucose 1-dehydrogenase [Hyphomicrobiales bacterium]
MERGRVEGKVAIVTGGARGIGAATARLLAREGASVLITDVLDGEGEAAASAIRATGAAAAYVRLDVSSEAAWAAAVEDAARRFGGLHVLVNNAAIARDEDVETETLEGWNRLLAIDLTGAWLGMRAAAPAMRRSGGGSIINVSSIYGLVGGTGSAAAYHASKGALRTMTKNAAIRYAKEGIRVNSLHPGFVDTPMIAPYLVTPEGRPSDLARWIESRTPVGRAGTPEEVANAILFLGSDESSYVTGSEVTVDGGYTAA